MPEMLDRYYLCTSSPSSFSLVNIFSSASVADFSLPLHPHKVIPISFPAVQRNSRPLTRSRNSTASTASNASIMSQSRRYSLRPLAQKMVTISSADRHSRVFMYDGQIYQWQPSQGSSKILKKLDTSPGSSVSGDGTICARYSHTKRKGAAVIFLDTSKCDERVSLATLIVCLKLENGFRGFLANIMKR